METIKADEVDEFVEDIEGLIVKLLSGKWVALFAAPYEINREVMRVQVDYNPWTGEKLT